MSVGVGCVFPDSRIICVYRTERYIVRQSLTYLRPREHARERNAGVVQIDSFPTVVLDLEVHARENVWFEQSKQSKPNTICSYIISS